RYAAVEIGVAALYQGPKVRKRSRDVPGYPVSIELMERRQISSRRHAKDCSVGTLAAKRGYSIEVPITCLNEACSYVCAVGTTGEGVERRQCTGRRNFEHSSKIAEAYSNCRSIEVAVFRKRQSCIWVATVRGSTERIQESECSRRCYLKHCAAKRRPTPVSGPVKISIVA